MLKKHLTFVLTKVIEIDSGRWLVPTVTKALFALACLGSLPTSVFINKAEAPINCVY